MLPHGASVKFAQAESCVRQKDVSGNFKFAFLEGSVIVGNDVVRFR